MNVLYNLNFDKLSVYPEKRLFIQNFFNSSKVKSVGKLRSKSLERKQFYFQNKTANFFSFNDFKLYPIFTKF